METMRIKAKPYEYIAPLDENRIPLVYKYLAIIDKLNQACEKIDRYVKDENTKWYIKSGIVETTKTILFAYFNEAINLMELNAEIDYFDYPGCDGFRLDNLDNDDLYGWLGDITVNDNLHVRTRDLAVNFYHLARKFKEWGEK